MAKPIRTFSLSLALAMTALGTAGAQSLLDAAPAITPTTPSASQAILSTRDSAPATPAPASVAFIPFEQSAPAYRFSGEDDTVRFTFALSPEQAASGGALALGLRNAVSVLPDTSSLTITVNGREAGSVPVASPNDFSARSIPVAADMLQAGRNIVEMRVRQFHRVDCSLEATYELWSELDPHATGFRPAQATGFTRINDLMTVARKDATTDLRLVLPQTATADMLNDALPALQTLALFLNRDDVSVSLGNTVGTGPGIDLMVSTDKTRAALGPAGATDPASSYGLTVGAAIEPGRATVSLRGANRDDLQAILLRAVGAEMKAGLDDGILAPRPGVIEAEASRSFTLADAGYESSVFTGRLSRTRFDLVMPADFYPGDYATIGVNLHAATSPGLNYTAQFLVRVNDMVVTSYPFRDTAGEQFDGKLIELPLRAFRPGINTVEFIAELPTAADATCAPEARDDTRPRFILLKETEIQIPALARISRLPDIGALAGAAYPYADDKPFDVVIERPDAQSAGAALTMLSRLSLAARKPLTAALKFGAPDPLSRRNALVIATSHAYAELGPAAKTGFPIAGNAVAATPAAIDMMRTAALVPATFDAIAAPSAPVDSGALLDAFRKSNTPPDDALSFTARAANWLSAASSRFRQWLNYQDGDAAPLSDDRALITVSQRLSPEGEGVWTVVEAQSPGDMSLGMHRLVDPAVWPRLTGGSAAIETASLSMTTLPASRHFIAGIPDKSPANLRRLTAAWFSDNFQFYVALVVGLMGIFAVWLGRTVPRKGVRTDQ